VISKKNSRKKSAEDYLLKKYLDMENIGFGDEIKFRMFIGTEFLIKFED